MVNAEWPIDADFEEFAEVGEDLARNRSVMRRQKNGEIVNAHRLTVREEIAGSVSNTWIERMKKLVANGDLHKIEFVSRGSAHSQPKASQYHQSMPTMDWREFERIAQHTQEWEPSTYQSMAVAQPIAVTQNQPIAPPQFQPIAPAQFQPIAPPHFQPISPPQAQPIDPALAQSIAPAHAQHMPAPQYSADERVSERLANYTRDSMCESPDRAAFSRALILDPRPPQTNEPGSSEAHIAWLVRMARIAEAQEEERRRKSKNISAYAFDPIMKIPKPSPQLNKNYPTAGLPNATTDLSIAQTQALGPQAGPSNATAGPSNSYTVNQTNVSAGCCCTRDQNVKKEECCVKCHTCGRHFHKLTGSVFRDAYCDCGSRRPVNIYCYGHVYDKQAEYEREWPSIALRNTRV